MKIFSTKRRRIQIGKADHHTRRRIGKPTFLRPTVELLEDRWLLTTFLVVLNTDAGGLGGFGVNGSLAGELRDDGFEKYAGNVDY